MADISSPVLQVKDWLILYTIDRKKNACKTFSPAEILILAGIREVIMKAVICTGYGPPEVLELREVVKPVPAKNEILIKVHATTCHIGDVRVRGFDVPFRHRIPFRLYLGLFRPKRKILGMEVAGTVEDMGKEVKAFAPGDPVFATTGFLFGGHAEYVCLAADSRDVRKGLVALKPENMSFDEAAAGATTGGLTALEVLKKADIRIGDAVLIYGASGSVGVFALQLAKICYGAHVTAVCSGANSEMVSSLGADRVIDYTKEDCTAGPDKYDVIFDAVSKLPRKKARKALKKKGRYLNVNRHSGSGKSITRDDLKLIKKLIEEEKLKTVIDRTYHLDQIIEAHRYVQKGHKKGHVVIQVP